MVEEAEGKLTKLRSEETTPTDVLTDAVNVKDISAEKVRMLNQHQASKKQMEAKAEKATAAKLEHVEARKKALEAAKVQYDATIVAINQDYDMFEEAETELINKNAKELEDAVNHFNEEIKKLDAYLLAKGPAQEQEEQPLPSSQQEPPQGPAITPTDVDIQAITKHLAADSRFKGSGEEAVGFAQSMIDLFNDIAKKKQETAAASGENDANMTHLVGTGGRPRPIRPGVVLALSDTSTAARAPAEKREGDIMDGTLPLAKK